MAVVKIGDDMDDNKSLSDLMREAYCLSLDVAFKTVAPDGHYFQTRDTGIPSEHDDMVWGWADGLMHGYYERISSGQCSLKAMIDFDIGNFEEEVRRDTNIMREILAKVGPPKRLTNEEMVALGYAPRKVKDTNNENQG